MGLPTMPPARASKRRKKRLLTIFEALGMRLVDIGASYNPFNVATWANCLPTFVGVRFSRLRMLPLNRFYTSQALFFFLLLVLTASGCVGRGKYLDALQSGAEASSDAASAKTDHSDAMRRYEQLQADYAHLLDSLEEQTEVRLTERSGSIDERQTLINRVTLQELLIDSLRTERNRLHKQRGSAIAVIDRYDSRLRQVQTRVASGPGTLLGPTMRTIRSTDELTFFLPESTLFNERRNPDISPAGDALLSSLAAALGGQPDLRIEVAAEPRDLSGAPSARLEAGRRAAIVVGNLVEGHGLDPQIVTATSLQIDPTTAALAPAEAGASSNTQIRVRIRIAGDAVGQIGQALRN